MTLRRSRRRFLQSAVAAGIGGFPMLARAASPRLLIVGGGFGGATLARYIRMIDPTIAVILVEREAAYVTCPNSNQVLAGMAGMADITVSYDALRGHGVQLIRAEARAIDPPARTVTLGDGSVLGYDRLVLAPGVEMRLDAIAGYDAAAMEKMPHAWKAGPQTATLRRQLEAMADGGTVIIAPPINPSRCPPGPYERASLIAAYLKRTKPKSKILIFDAKETFPQQETFQDAWATFYPGMIDWFAASSGGAITSVDASAMTVTTDFGAQKGDVVNIIPPQRAPKLLRDVGLVDPWGWCPIQPATFEATLTNYVHAVGDATDAVVMAKSATSANSQAKVCASAIVALFQGRSPETPSFAGTCYSTVAPDFAIAVTDVYRAAWQSLHDSGTTNRRELYSLHEMLGPRGYAEAGFTPAMRRQAAEYAKAWYAGIVADSFG